VPTKGDPNTSTREKRQEWPHAKIENKDEGASSFGTSGSPPKKKRGEASYYDDKRQERFVPKIRNAHEVRVSKKNTGKEDKTRARWGGRGCPT